MKKTPCIMTFIAHRVIDRYTYIEKTCANKENLKRENNSFDKLNIVLNIGSKGRLKVKSSIAILSFLSN